MADRPADEAELDASRAPFLEHLQELRWRLWRALVGVIIAAVVCFMFHRQLYEFLTEPLVAVMEKHNLPPVLKYRTVTGAFLFHFKTAILGGIFFGVPIILYQLWQFVAPGLYRNERRMALPFVFASTVCFVGGAAFAYYKVFPYAFDFLLNYTVSSGAHRLEPDITVEDYLGFVTKLLLAFGLVFEMPVATGFLSGIGVITHRALLRFWRWAVVLAFVLAALLTPPDYITQILLAIPLILLYGASIGIAWFITTRREAAMADDEADEDPLDPPPPAAAGGAPDAEA